MTMRIRSHAVVVGLGVLLAAGEAAARQQPQPTPTGISPGTSHGIPKFGPGQQGSPNIKVLSHVPLGGAATVGDIEIEQELTRPYAYVGRLSGYSHDIGFTILSIKDPAKAKVLYDWRILNRELMDAYGGLRGVYFKLKGRYYYVQCFQIRPGSPDTDLGAVVFDVTSLPDTSGIREVGRIRDPQHIGGFHNVYAYKHSDGRVLLFTTSTYGFARIYDMEKFLAVGDKPEARVSEIPIPGDVAAPIPVPGTRVLNVTGTYHDFYIGYDPATHQDKFYGAAWSAGYFIFDVTRPEEPKLITSITGVPGGGSYHTFTPTPDGRYAVGEQEYQLAPLRFYDLKPGLDGTVKTINRPIGAWTANWRDLPHNQEVRWPYVFVSAYEDGLQVINMMDPANPYTVASYYTYEGQHVRGSGGVFGVDIRNADGVIVVSDMHSGFWAFKMDGFDGWNGRQWGMPNVSSAQDWDNGPEGVPKPARATS